MSDVIIGTKFDKTDSVDASPVLNGLHIRISGTISDTVTDLDEIESIVPFNKRHIGDWLYKYAIYVWDPNNVEDTVHRQLSGVMNTRQIVVPSNRVFDLTSINKQSRKDLYVTKILAHIHAEIGNTENEIYFKHVETALKKLIGLLVGDAGSFIINYIYTIDCPDDNDKVLVHLPDNNPVLVMFNSKISVPAEAKLVTYNNISDFIRVVYEYGEDYRGRTIETKDGDRETLRRFNDYNSSLNVVSVLSKDVQHLRMRDGGFYGTAVPKQEN